MYTTVEVVRLVTDGTKNACSCLYSASARSAKELGYEKIQTYILEEESGISLVASGWYLDQEKAGGGQWKHTDGNPRRKDQPIGFKQRWAKQLNPHILPNKVCTRPACSAKEMRQIILGIKQVGDSIAGV